MLSPDEAARAKAFGEGVMAVMDSGESKDKAAG